LKILGPQICNIYPASDLASYLLDNMDYCLRLVGKDFPLWKNKKVTVKVIEHALCEFQKFEELDAGCTNGQRKWYSRASRDEREHCPTCASASLMTTTMIRCDTCHLIVCENCQKDQFQRSRAAGSSWNCCKPCHALEQSEHLLL
jgi:hypothetical protein